MSRLLLIGRIADSFHQLQSVVAAALDDDPEQLDRVCLELLGYAHVKAQFDQAGTDDKALEHLKDHPFMLAVRRNSFDLFNERRKRQVAAATNPGPDHKQSRRGEQATLPDAPSVKPKPLEKRERAHHGR